MSDVLVKNIFFKIEESDKSFYLNVKDAKKIDSYAVPFGKKRALGIKCSYKDPETNQKHFVLERVEGDIYRRFYSEQTDFTQEQARNELKTYDELILNFKSPEKQVSTPPLSRRDINSKENIMSDEHVEYEVLGDEKTFFPSTEKPSVTPEELAFRHALHQRRIITDALKDGTLSCLPGADGFADTNPALNLTSGDYYHGANLLYIKEHQKQHGFPTGEYITTYQINKANKADPEIALKEDQKGVDIYFSEKNEKTEEWETQKTQVYNIAQTTNPQALKNWVETTEQERIAKMKDQFSESYKTPTPKPKIGSGPVISCTSTDPEKYLGQYLAAVSMGGKFKASPGQATEFSQKLEGALFEKMNNGHTNPFKLSRISNEASLYCKSVIREVKMEIQKQNQPEQQQTQTQGRHM